MAHTISSSVLEGNSRYCGLLQLDLMSVVGDCAWCWSGKCVEEWIMVLEEADRRRGWKMLLV